MLVTAIVIILLILVFSTTTMWIREIRDHESDLEEWNEMIDNWNDKIQMLIDKGYKTIEEIPNKE